MTQSCNMDMSSLASKNLLCVIGPEHVYRKTWYVTHIKFWIKQVQGPMTRRRFFPIPINCYEDVFYHALLVMSSYLDSLLLQISDMIKGNESHVEDFQFWVFDTYFLTTILFISTENNMKEYFAIILKTISATYDSFHLIMSHTCAMYRHHVTQKLNA